MINFIRRMFGIKSKCEKCGTMDFCEERRTRASSFIYMCEISLVCKKCQEYYDLSDEMENKVKYYEFKVARDKVLRKKKNA